MAGKKINKFRKGTDEGKNGKAHKIDHPGYNVNNGRNESVLSEPVPEYFARPGDMVLNASWVGGQNNNATIIFGRDRTGVGETDGDASSEFGEVDTDSLGRGSYGDFMAAGAIDIVCGRGAPFPVQTPGYSLGPLFNTQYDILDLQKTQLSGSLPEEVTADHPGYAMDAARIYISQMTNVDFNFGITESLTEEELYGETGTDTVPPSSAIMLKSDKIRLHAREDLKIVTGGPDETINSQGEPIMVRGGIHLVAQNEVGKQQPIPLGNNLENCLYELTKVLDNITDNLKRFAESQLRYNNAISDHTHISTPSVPTTFDIVLAPLGTSTAAWQFSWVIAECDKAASNLEYIRSEFLNPGGNSGENDSYINSPYNTTN